tara:strand:+ start:1377 stop:2192 length:816 start_codon:yes stop_codon:yes gene_type:complete
MKFKHNKKRNTALLYECLVKELTRSVLKEDMATKEKIISILKEFFTKNAALAKELSIYKSISEPSFISKTVAEKILNESKKQLEQISKEAVFEEQSRLIKEINSSFDQDIFSNFVPHYKSLATIYQLFNLDASPKQKVILEEKVIDMMIQPSEERNLEAPVHNNLVFKKFIEKFNEKYSGSLMKEQKELLNKYIVSSLKESSLELKIFVNEELGRIRKTLELVRDNPVLQKKSEKIFETIDNFKNQKVDINSIKRMLHLQQLASEIEISDN